MLSDAQRVWCINHPVATLEAGEALGLTTSEYVRRTAEVDQAVVDGDWARALALVKRWAAEQAGKEPDPRQGMGAMLAWETEAPDDFSRACLTAFLDLGGV